MSIQFPDAPAQGDSFVATNGVSYTYDNGGWIANSQSALDDRYVNLNGDTMTGDLTVPSLNGGPLAGFRNQLINGGMAVNQRGLTLYPSGRANEYTVDRWFTSTGLSVSWYSDTNFMPAGFTAAIEIGVTSGQEAVINQRIEQPNAGFWAAPGSTWTLSAWVDKPDNFELNLSYRNSANTVLASFSKVGALVKGETSGIFTRVSQVFTAPAFTAGTEYTQANFANLTSGEVTRFTGAQLEPGPVATPFEQRPIGAELALCQRYYESHVSPDNNNLTWMGTGMAPGAGYSGYATSTTLTFNTTKRVIPTCVMFGLDLGSGFTPNELHIQDTNAGVNATINSYTTTIRGVSPVFAAAEKTQYNVLCFGYTADAEL